MLIMVFMIMIMMKMIVMMIISTIVQRQKKKCNCHIVENANKHFLFVIS